MATLNAPPDKMVCDSALMMFFVTNNLRNMRLTHSIKVI